MRVLLWGDKRYAALCKLMESVGAGIEIKDQALVYEPVEAGKEIRIYWYPDTPIGFYEVFGSTLDEACDKLIELQVEEEEK